MKIDQVPIRAVFDTNVIRGGLRSRRRPEYQCIRTIVESRILALATPALFLEYEDVLLRESTLAATGFSPAEMHDFLTALATLVVPVRVDFDWRPLLPDPGDDMVANCALNGRADCVVTSNVRHLRPLQERFGIPVLVPAQFIELMPNNADRSS